MSLSSATYTAYLLRLWQTDPHHRIILQNVHTGEQHLFNSMSDLFAFMTRQHGVIEPDSTSPTKS